ncbi:MAG: SRPBCC family protein [Gammaproteobacteria bacterium]
MDRTEQMLILNELMGAIDAERAMDSGRLLKNPTASFVDQDLAAREWNTLFRDHPQMLGLSGDLPSPGSFITTNYLGTPILATRAEDGRFRAFVNACRHRGAPLTTEARGERLRFVCRYHAWTYAADGELVGIANPDQFGANKQSCLNLVELPAAERYGMLFVHPRVDGVLNVDALLGDIAPELASWGLEQATYLGDQLIDSKLNWKLAQDIFGENYHVKALHKDTLAKVAYSDISTYREYGRHHRLTVPMRYIDSMRRQPEQDWNLLDAAVLVYHVFPNVQFVFVNGAVSVTRIYPDPRDVGHSYSVLTHYATAGAQVAVDSDDRLTGENLYANGASCNKVWDRSAMEELFDSTAEQEDYWMGTKLQQTAASGAIDYFVIGRNEQPVQHFHQSYRSALGLPPLEEFVGTR